MAKEILLYGPIYNSTAEDFMSKLESAKSDNIAVRTNSPGGDPYAMYGMIAKYKEHAGEKVMKIDGYACSCAAYMCCASDEVEALDVSELLFHRAAFPAYIESNKDYFTDELKAQVTNTNVNLRALLESKTTPRKFKAISGVSMDDMFSLDNRIDVKLTAEQAMKMGIVTKIVPLTTEKKTEINALCSNMGMTAQFNETTSKIQPNNMTLAQLKADHPEVYAQAVKEGTEAESDRILGWMAYSEIDAVAVKAGIESGKSVTGKQQNEFIVKAMSKKTLDEKKDDNAAAVIPTGDAAAIITPEAKNVAEFLATCKKDLKLK